MHNESLAKVLRGGERAFLTSAGGCDCGTVLGAPMGPSEDEMETDRTKQREKLRRKGWSAAKIARWFESVDHAESRPRAKLDSFALWSAALADVMKTFQLRSVGLFVHQYEGAIDAEVVSASRRDCHSRADIVECLQSLKEDELVMVHGA